MLTVSLHGIRIQSGHGLYPQENLLGNEFEVDVDVFLKADNAAPWPFVDYTLIRGIVHGVFDQPGQLLETLVQHIHSALKMNIADTEKIRVAVRKLHPPMQGDVRYAQVCFEG